MSGRRDILSAWWRHGRAGSGPAGDMLGPDWGHSEPWGRKVLGGQVGRKQRIPVQTGLTLYILSGQADEESTGCRS